MNKSKKPKKKIFSILEGLPENSTDPSIDSIDVGNVTVKDIKDFVRLFFYRKNHPQFINSASFAPNGREVVQIKLTDQFDSNLDTKFIIHGWLNNKNSLQFQQLKEAYHASADYNIFSKHKLMHLSLYILYISKLQIEKSN